MDVDLGRLVEALQGLKVVVLGDAILDVYLEGTAGRLSREAPIPIVDVRTQRDLPGGAANAATNVAALGGQVRFVSVIGDDEYGRRLLSALEARGVDTSFITVEPGRRTTAKSRLLGSGQMLARYDHGTADPINEVSEHKVCARLKEAVDDADAVIISDYCCGMLTVNLVRTSASLQKAAPRVLVVDSRRPELLPGSGATAVKPSFEEALRLIGIDAAPLTGRAEVITAHQEKILNRTGAQIAAVTLDADGAVILERGRPPYRTYARPTDGYHATGGGDTFVAAFALALSAGAEVPEAAELASASAAVAVGKDGTATCTAEELQDRIAGGARRAMDLFSLASRLSAYRAQGKRIVFTNGCFDILHRGHVTLLNKAKALGDILVVGINSDASIRRLKGHDRPINSLEDRIKVLAALSYIDHIVPFDTDTPGEIIAAVRPDIFVKGGDYTRETLPEAPLVESLGGAVCILPLTEERSTSRIIRRIREAG